MSLYGRCVVQEEPSDARRVLGLAPGSAAETALLRAISTDHCLSGHGAVDQLGFQPQLLRGVIAEEVYHLDVSPRRRRRDRQLVAPFTNLTPEEISGLQERGRRSLRALDFAQCIYQSTPDGVVALLNTPDMIRREDDAFERLSPHFSPCLPQGARMAIVKPQLRGFLAEAAYRAAYASSAQTGQMQIGR